MDAARQTASSKKLILGQKIFNEPIHPALVMGIINVTPDSFSDGGAFLDPEAAAARAMELIAEGAAIIDIGGESTRPGSLPVAAEVQINRVAPVIKRVRSLDRDIHISIDTTLSAVARAAIRAGANIVNDTSALRDDQHMARLVAQERCTVVLMHRKGTPPDMQQGGGPTYADVFGEISSFFRERMDHAIRSGIESTRIILDPGIGFGKRTQDNLHILDGLSKFRELGRPLLVGASRKRFIGEVLGLPEPKDRDMGSVACALIAAINGASVVRVHDVRSTVAALRLLEAVQHGAQTDH